MKGAPYAENIEHRRAEQRTQNTEQRTQNTEHQPKEHRTSCIFMNVIVWTSFAQLVLLPNKNGCLMYYRIIESPLVGFVGQM